MGITSRLVTWFVRHPERTSDPEVRLRYGALEAWVSIVVNTLMAAAKFGLGLWIDSVALLADAGHTLSDTLTSVVVLVGFRSARRPVDREHPHGHGRMESIATLVIATMLAIVGLEFLLQSVRRLVTPVEVRSSALAVVAMLVSAVIKEWMARFSLDLGKRIRSSALAADAWHHRSDAVASFLVALAILGASLGLNRLDGIFGVGVSLLILYTGVDLIRSSASYLIGERPDEEMLEEVRSAAQSVPGVIAIHDIEVHDYGQHKDVSLHIEVAADATVVDAHAVASKVEEAVNRRLNVSTVVHVDPLGEVPPPASEHEVHAAIEAVLAHESEVAGYHAVTLYGGEAGKGRVHFHVTVDGRMELRRSHDLSHRLNRLVCERLPGCQVTIHMEPSKSV
jgi:cation diffusion facilitator family transporter